ncbi:MAG: FAD-binding oxidoreductase, partial [Sphingomonadales bacterium]
MRKFHELKIKEVIKETPDAVSITFEVPTKLEKVFTFVQGQHLTLRKEINGEDLRRSYSLCTSVNEGKLKVAIRKVIGGRFSNFANENFKKGDLVEVMAPAGHFYVDLNEKKTRRYVAFAAGSGITPIMSIIKTTLEIEPNSKFMLFYGNRTRQSTIFRDEISFLKNKYIDRFSYWHFFDEEDLEIEFFKGPMTEDKIKKLLKTLIDVNEIDHTFVCGPEMMMDTIIDVFTKTGVSPEKLHSERFLSEGYTPASLSVEDQKTAKEMDSEVTIILDGDEQKIKMDGFLPILDKAMEAGLDV